MVSKGVGVFFTLNIPHLEVGYKKICIPTDPDSEEN